MPKQRLTFLSSPAGGGNTQLFTSNYKNFQALNAGGVPIALGANYRVPRAIDWNNDGLMDLMASSNGAVWIFLNIGNATTASFAAGTRVTAGGATIAVSGSTGIALADMTGDGVKDLLVSDSGNKIRIYANTAAANATPVYAASTFLKNSSNADLAINNSRFDVGDWNNDGLPDVIIGSFSGSMQVFLNTGTASAPRISTTGTTVTSDSYNIYPRLFDISHSGYLDLVRGINWGNINYWIDPVRNNGVLGSSGQFTITDTTNATADVRAVTDGAIVDFADFNGDGVYDMLIGGHNSSTGIYIAYGQAKTFAQYITDLETIYDANIGNLGPALEANSQALLNQVKAAELGMISLIQIAPLTERQAMFNQFFTHVQKYSFLQWAQLNTTTYHHVPSIVGQNVVTMMNMLPATPTNRAAVANAVGMPVGLYRDLLIQHGKVIGDNVTSSTGQLQSYKTFLENHRTIAIPMIC